MLAELQNDARSVLSVPMSLNGVLDSIPDQNDRARFKSFYDIAIRTQEMLAQMEVPSAETEAEHQKNDLWNKLRSQLGATIDEITAFFKVVDELFPAREVSQDDFDVGLEFAFSEPQDEVITTTEVPHTPVNPVSDVIAALRVIEHSLKHEVKNISELLSHDEISQDSWLQFDNVAQFSGKMRSGLNEMLFLAARVFANVHKTDVVPNYQDDIELAVTLRQGVVELRAQILVYHGPIRNIDEPDQVKSWALEIQNLLQQFFNGKAHTVMRAADKRAMGRFAGELELVLAAPVVDVKKIQELVEGLMRFLDSLTVINRREALLVHDKDMLAALNKRMDVALMDLQMYALGSARHNLKKGLAILERLTGRDELMDYFRVVTAHFDIEHCSAYELYALLCLIKRRIHTISNF